MVLPARNSKGDDMRKYMMLTMMAVLLVVGAAHAQTAYVADVFEITLRSGPTNSNKILKMLPSSTPVEVLRNDKDWSLVRTEGVEGWVLARYLTRTVPAALQVERFAKENETLRAKMAEMTEKTSATTGENQALLDRLNRAETELASLQQRYAELEQGSKAYVDLQKAHDELVALQAETAQQAEALEMKNRDLSGDTQFRWFLTGAGVVGASLLLGLVLGRLQRKKTGRIFA
ncbi:MAG: TIGR04211 family SH3 domain-containing protein [Deltaproteobacteria bacterium HGW-Deltaproteobacteria-18]|nr:MAG: TIGR04211 family SH3 domain-containing protein [Deltaproteobacteria bacterium HGW-Deltaproteobacteria-18]